MQNEQIVKASFMGILSGKLIICSSEQVDCYRDAGITHLVSVRNPGISIDKPGWFRGLQLGLHFGDVVSDTDAQQYRTKAPTMDDIRRTVSFTSDAWMDNASKVLINCDYGASRSPALAYVAFAAKLGADREHEAFQAVLDIRPEAVPNMMVVELGNKFLQRGGKLMVPLIKLNQELERLLKEGGSSF